MYSLLNLLPCLWILNVAIAVRVPYCRIRSCFSGESESSRRGGEETGFDCFDGAVDYGVDGVDNVVDEGLA